MDRNSMQKMSKSMGNMKLGMGGRFHALESKMMDEGKSKESAGAIAASAGRKRYGAKKMAKWSAAGRKRNA